MKSYGSTVDSVILIITNVDVKQISRYITSIHSEPISKKLYFTFPGKLHEATNITPSKRMTPAANYDDVDKYARFPLDYVIAAKFLQLNLLVFNEKQEWEVYRPDATICQPVSYSQIAQ